MILKSDEIIIYLGGEAGLLCMSLLVRYFRKLETLYALTGVYHVLRMKRQNNLKLFLET